MKYIQCDWVYTDSKTPIIIYSELDNEQWEKRKVEVFSDGHRTFADEKREVGDSFLGEEPWPDLEKLGMEPEFKIKEITKENFELIWSETIKLYT